MFTFPPGPHRPIDITAPTEGRARKWAVILFMQGVLR